MNKEIDNVNHPMHYTTGFAPVTIECIDIARHLPFTLGNAFKYVWRAGKKGDKAKALEDLDKARWYLEDSAGSPDGDLSKARAIFALLPYDTSDRYQALFHILRCQGNALDAIQLLKEELENEAGV